MPDDRDDIMQSRDLADFIADGPGPRRGFSRAENGFIYIYDLQTGEILDESDCGESAERPFLIESPEAADWVLNLMAAEEGKLAEIEVRRAALVANLESMTVGPRNRLAWLHRRFDGDLIAQAQRDLATQGGKCKTAKYPHGQVALRKTAGKASITDMPAAVRYVEEWAPDHVKKLVGIEAVKLAIRTEADFIDDDAEERTDTAPFFRNAEPAEKWSIETGVRVEGTGNQGADR